MKAKVCLDLQNDVLSNETYCEILAVFLLIKMILSRKGSHMSLNSN